MKTAQKFYVFLAFAAFLIFAASIYLIKLNYSLQKQMTSTLSYKPDSKGIYLQLKIKETKTEGSINFTLKSSSIVYKQYSHIIPYDATRTNENDYTLTVYDSSETKIAEYFLSSSRFIFWDSINGRGGIIEDDEGTIVAAVPFDRNRPIVYIKILDNRTKKETKYIPVSAKPDADEKQIKFKTQTIAISPVFITVNEITSESSQ